MHPRAVEAHLRQIIRIPYTTDFAILFLPIEGLYAEALKRPSLSEKLQTKYRVIVAGPTTLSALLSSLQMGFRSVAVEKRSEEIWRLLGTVARRIRRYATYWNARASVSIRPPAN
jgi:DNA recombination protein RmuC